jgi:3-polyprenyl-4-hydroxybenzoate decarboxylase
VLAHGHQRTQHQRSPLPPRRQHRPATRQHGGRPQGLTKGPSDELDHATSEIAIGSKLGIDATKKLPAEGFKRPWPPLIKMDESVKAKVEKLFG